MHAESEPGIALEDEPREDRLPLESRRGGARPYERAKRKTESMSLEARCREEETRRVSFGTDFL